MREKIRELVIEAITDTDKLTEIVDKLCDLHNVSNRLTDDLINDKAFDKKTANDVANSYLQAKRKYFIKGAKWARNFFKENGC